MMYYQDEVITELTVGEEYTVRQLRILLNETNNVLVISNSVQQFSESNGLKKVRVLNKIEAYAHRFDRHNDAYILPSSKSITYIVE
ncbi:hypothetical protein SAMN05880501_10767 [Ureibacillus xyleni]|uniref:Uncharacterized protein n=1 Tax=Ureibacillus xyleni TaxID=614648 RepID=A0A285SX07_9BACL|nr:hypothetical protein [Ureibacillus xyleni]SOC12877.1 hypothetical protein SAMN05880501_10767 [Ureibacillus xyleni]